MTRELNLLRAALALGLSVVSPARAPTITEDTARKLVQEALLVLGEREKSLRVESWEFYWAPEFYTFQAWRGQDVAPGEVGILKTYYFAVNPWTGDVWDAVGCKRITSPAIETEQENIWKRSGLPSDVREAVRKRSPADCSVNKQKTNEKKDRSGRK